MAHERKHDRARGACERTSGGKRATGPVTAIECAHTYVPPALRTRGHVDAGCTRGGRSAATVCPAQGVAVEACRTSTVLMRTRTR